MKQYLYSFYNTLGGFFKNVTVENVGPEDYQAGFIRTAYTLDVLALTALAEDDVYLVGVFDTDSGEIINKHEFILHCSDICLGVVAKKKLVAEKMEEVNNG